MLTLQDGAGWTFVVRTTDGVIQVVNGPSNIGKIYKPTDAVYKQVVANLAAVNPQLPAALAHLTLGELPAPGGGKPNPTTPNATGAVVETPIYKRGWFLALAGVAGVALLGGGAYVATKGMRRRNSPQIGELDWDFAEDSDPYEVWDEEDVYSSDWSADGDDFAEASTAMVQVPSKPAKRKAKDKRRSNSRRPNKRKGKSRRRAS